jgi:hypothetical protein
MENSQIALIEDIASFTHDPLGYVKYAFPWGENDSQLANYSGPREWQGKVLEHIGNELQSGKKVIMIAICSGHGIGKTALVGMITKWGIDTRENTRIRVTANTDEQLSQTTWPEVTKWNHMAITRDWFEWNASSIHSKEKDLIKSWRIDRANWSEHNPEAFAGLHNLGNRIIIVFDEASGIPDIIWEVTEGVLKDENTEIIWIALGNPTKSTGRFRECFTKNAHRWFCMQIDARTVEGVNKEKIQQELEDWGEDSDYFRIRVRGMFPNSSSCQFIDSSVVAAAMKREAISHLSDPLILGIDIARGGNDNMVFYFRRGLDARSIPPTIVPGYETRDSMKMISLASELIRIWRPDAIMVDSTGGLGGAFADRLRELGHVVFDVCFSAASSQKNLLNLRTEIWFKMKDWLKHGAIPDDTRLETELTTPEYYHKDQKLALQKKEDMPFSPDIADALACTFAFYVPPVDRDMYQRSSGRAECEFDPFEDRN